MWIGRRKQPTSVHHGWRAQYHVLQMGRSLGPSTRTSCNNYYSCQLSQPQLCIIRSTYPLILLLITLVFTAWHPIANQTCRFHSLCLLTTPQHLLSTLISLDLGSKKSRNGFATSWTYVWLGTALMCFNPTML